MSCDHDQAVVDQRRAALARRRLVGKTLALAEFLSFTKRFAYVENRVRIGLIERPGTYEGDGGASKRLGRLIDFVVLKPVVSSLVNCLLGCLERGSGLGVACCDKNERNGKTTGAQHSGRGR